jgi:hypothetical protein
MTFEIYFQNLIDLNFVGIWQPFKTGKYVVIPYLAKRRTTSVTNSLFNRFNLIICKFLDITLQWLISHSKSGSR